MSGINSGKSAVQKTNTLIGKLTTGVTGMEICSRVIDSLENTHGFHESIGEFDIQELVTLLRKFSRKEGERNYSSFQKEAFNSLQKMLFEKLEKIDDVHLKIKSPETLWPVFYTLPIGVGLGISVCYRPFKYNSHRDEQKYKVITSTEEIDIIHTQAIKKFFVL